MDEGSEARAAGTETDEQITDAAAGSAGDGESAMVTAPEKPWWDNPAFPWRGKPTRADLGCMWAIAGLGVYGLAMWPLRPVLFSISPYLSALINGGAVSMIRIGANIGAHHDPIWLWVLGLLIGTLSLVKFDWIFWWAGRLWGDRLIDYLLQNRGGLAKRNAKRAERLTHKYDILAMAITYIPFIPFPSAIVYGALGIAGTSLRKFLLLDISLALVTRGIYMYIGYRVGKPAEELFKQLDQYASYVSIALFIGIIVMMVWRSGRRKNAEVAAADDEVEPSQD